MKARDFGVGHLDCVTGAVVLDLGCELGLLRECLPSRVDGTHQPVKVGAQRLETCGIQQETALGRGVAGGARRRAAGLRESNLLVLTEQLDLALAEVELRVGDGGHHTS